jgi:hypothetical protein
MYKFLLSSIFFIFIVQYASAQQIKNPIPDKEIDVVVPPPPGENYSWVKPHWEYQKTQYVWIEGHYIETLENHKWMDGYWKRNTSTGWWVFNPGYWQKINDQMQVEGGKDVQVVNDVSPEKPSNTQSVFIKVNPSSEK